MSTMPANVAALIDRGLTASQAGQVESARKFFAQALALSPDDPDILFQLGVNAAKAHDVVTALSCLERAKVLRPSDAVIHYSLGITYGRCNDAASAVAAYQEALRLRPDFCEASLNLGNVYTRQHELDRAVTTYRLALQYHPAYAKIFINLASIYILQRRWQDLRDIAQSALSARPAFMEGRICMGLALTGGGQAAVPGNHPPSVVTGDRDLAGAHHNLAVCLHSLKDYENAIKQYKIAYELNPNLSGALANIGAIYHAIEDYDQARHYYQQALQRNPRDVGTLINSAEISEKTHDLARAEALASQALELEPSNPLGNRILATLLRRDGRYAEALNQLRTVEIPEHDDMLAQSIHYELGRLYDQTGQPNQAIRHFTRCKQHIKNLSPTSEQDRTESLAEIDKLLGRFTSDWIGTWQRFTPPSISPRFAFLVGFPRSGTTLLDQILDSHPRIQVIEERPMLTRTLDAITSRHPGYPENLSRLNAEEILEFRETYLASVGEYINIDHETSLVVDKFPLNIIHAGLVQRLFPEAFLIFAIRHPCDACLSCFMQPFTHNKGMSHFYSLDNATAYYAKVMELWATYNRLLPLTVVTSRYEDLVADFRGRTTQLLAALGVEWSDAVLDYSEHAKRRGQIRTPSYEQVTKSIYKEAAYRWQRYQEYFAPYMERLAPFIKEFGYGQ
jgi:tetratricopeptide (TPR) repeat protein